MNLNTLKQLSKSGSIDLNPRKAELIRERREMENFLAKSTDPLVYGIHTGFGPHAFLSNESTEHVQKSLVYHLTVEKVFDSTGNPKNAITHEEARAVLAARIHSLSLGGSGISFETLEILNHLLGEDCIPILPERGSLSASGDLIPLSYIALALMGESHWTGIGKEKAPSVLYPKKTQIPGLPWTPQAKEAISITNGTTFTTALLGLQILRLRSYLNLTLEILEFLFSYHKVFPTAFLPSLHTKKKFLGPVYVSEKLYPVISRNPKLKIPQKRIQDQYSVRCVPQILGSIFDELDQITDVVESELNSLSDNPVFLGEYEGFAEGGNFYASQVSFSVDRMQNLFAVYSTWMERFLNYLYNPQENGEFPLMLSPNPGKDAGLSGLGLLATHITADIRRDSMPASVQSIPSNGNNQDIVPMGAIGVLRNRRSLNSLRKLLGIFCYTVLQTSYLTNQKDLPKILKGLSPLSEDRSLYEEIQILEDRIQSIE
ncbi:MAG: aromatic amino acid ammonia-lyase [Leptospira sp.]|nr:aromatic amino acid ammonia-lyase [Leptospira sp.]